MGIVTSKKIFDKHFDKDIYKLISTLPRNREKRHRYYNIARNREVLRRWFAEQRKEDYLFWLDSDEELIYSNTLSMAINLAEKREGKSYTVVLPKEGRKSKKASYGLGGTLVHRSMADCGRFYINKIKTLDNKDTERKKEYTMSEVNCYMNSLEVVFDYLNKRNIRHNRENLYFKLGYEEIPYVHHIRKREFEDRAFVDVLKKDGGKKLKRNYKDINIRQKH